MFAVLLSADAQRFTVENENATRDMQIHKNSTLKIAVQILQNRHMTLVARCPNPAVRTPVKDVAIVEDRSRFPASTFDSERVLAGVTFPPATAKPDSVPRAAKCALFFMDELREG